MSQEALELWIFILTLGLGIIGYFARRRDKQIDDNSAGLKELNDRLDAEARALAKANGDLDLKVAEKYATKETMLKLFEETSKNHKESVERVEKRIDETNSTIEKRWTDTNNSINAQSLKIDKVIETLGNFQTTIMTELVKKT